MIKKTITLRELSDSKSESETQFEVYDEDTGTSLGIYDRREDAEAEVERMNQSDVAGYDDSSRKQDADPAEG